MADVIAARLDLLADLAQALAQRQDDLVTSQGEDIGAPCTIAAFEVDLAVEHLKTMATEVPYVQGKAPYGTVAAIFPYDAPPIMLARVGAPRYWAATASASPAPPRRPAPPGFSKKWWLPSRRSRR